MQGQIRRSLKYLIIFFGVIILLPTVFYLLLQISEIQTYLVKRVTNHLSAKFKSTISVGKTDYKFFNRLSIDNLLIKDMNNDTMIYSANIIVGLKRADFKKKIFRFGKVSLTNPVIALITDSSGMMNLTRYLNLLKSPDDTVKKAGSSFHFDEIDIINAKFARINHFVPHGKTKLDFNNLRLLEINGIIEDINILNDTTSFSIYNLGFREACGFRLKKLNTSLSIASNDIRLKFTSIICDSSIINIPRLNLTADSTDSFKKFTEKVNLDIQISKSLINTTDLKYFIPAADSLNETVWLSGKFSGPISELRGRDIFLSFGKNTLLDCDFDFSGLPKIENTYLYIGINSLRTNAKDFENIQLAKKGVLALPDPLKKLGDISFNGSFTGFTTDFVTYGEVQTSQGNLRTDISLRPQEKGRYKIKGLVTGSNINLGEISGSAELFGKLSMNVNIDGYANSLKKFSGSVTGKVDSVEFKKYIYRNITLSGSFTEKTWDGSVKITDRNIKLDLLGLLNFNNKLPKFDFTLNITDANLYKLNIDKLDTTANVTLLLTSAFKGTNIDNLDGEIKILNSRFRKFGKELGLNDFSIRTFKENNHPVLSLRTDFVDADINGYYNFAGFRPLINSKLADLLPSQFRVSGRQTETGKNNFTFRIDFKNTDKINEFLKTGMLLSEKSYIKGIITTDSMFNIDGRASLFTYKNNTFKDLSLSAGIARNEFSLNIYSKSLNLIGQSDLKDFKIELKTKPDNFAFAINWDNRDKTRNQGSIIAHGTLKKNMTSKANSILSIDIDSSYIYSENKLWKLSESSIIIDSTSIAINKLLVSNNERYYQVYGSLSENPADTLHIKFNGINIEPLNYLLSRNNSADPNALDLKFKGHLDGKILLSNVYKNLLLAGNILVKDFSVLGSNFGDISINSTLDNNKKIVNINASNNLNSVKLFDVNGFYDPAAKKIELTANTNKLPIVFLNPLLKVFASEISGTASGKLKLSLESGNLFLVGAVAAENTSMKIDFLQTKYKLNDSVRFNKNGIRFNNVRLTDLKGNVATLGGIVYHKNLKDYSADLVININSPDLQVLNTQPKDNSMFYGTAYASGVAKIRSDMNTLSFDIVARTGKNSKFAIPLNKGLSVSEYTFISFEDSTSLKKQQINSSKPTIASPQKQTGMDLKMYLEVTPDAEIQIIFDSKIGDEMKGHGSSPQLNVTLNKNGDFGIVGEYLITDGDYTFTLGNVVNKTFSVENGGKITFNGDLKDAEIDLKASYLNLKTSLSTIIPNPDPGSEDKYSKSIRVEPQLKLSGKLFNPIVGFDIFLPDADEETRTYLRNAISTEEELTRQVFALLLINKFISVGATPSTTSTGTAAMAATTFEMVSNQISNWLSKISKDVDIGLNIRPGSNAITPQEAQLAVSTQILNNKVVFNGNFDVKSAGSNASNTNQLTGVFDAEIKLTEKLRFKVFNRFNDVYNNALSPYTQGVGIFYNQDFNNFSDLFRKKQKTEMKKEEDVTIMKQSE